MKRLVIVLSLFAVGALLAAESEAARLGGGRSIGSQRSVTRSPSATPAKPAQQQAAPSQNAAPAQPASPAQQPSGLSRWLPALGGLAIGGLIGSLFGGSGFGGILLLALLAFVTVAVVKAFMRRGEAPRPAQFAGLGERVPMPREEPVFGGAPAAQAKVPAGFDTASFLKGAKLNFVKLQLANDLGRLDEIREFTTTEMFDELKREAPAPGQQTDIVGLDADLLEVATEGDRHWASVRFSGTVRETPQAAPEGFEEVWNLVKPADGSTGWLLAGIQQMH
jgi:predicted lipid-binding transport protein (Tim44 family)